MGPEAMWFSVPSCSDMDRWALPLPAPVLAKQQFQEGHTPGATLGVRSLLLRKEDEGPGPTCPASGWVKKPKAAHPDAVPRPQDQPWGSEGWQASSFPGTAALSWAHGPKTVAMILHHLPPRTQGPARGQRSGELGTRGHHAENPGSALLSVMEWGRGRERRGGPKNLA